MYNLVHRTFKYCKLALLNLLVLATHRWEQLFVRYVTEMFCHFVYNSRKAKIYWRNFVGIRKIQFSHSYLVGYKAFCVRWQCRRCWGRSFISGMYNSWGYLSISKGGLRSQRCIYARRYFYIYKQLYEMNYVIHKILS